MELFVFTGAPSSSENDLLSSDFASSNDNDFGFENKDGSIFDVNDVDSDRLDAKKKLNSCRRIAMKIHRRDLFGAFGNVSLSSQHTIQYSSHNCEIYSKHRRRRMITVIVRWTNSQLHCCRTHHNIDISTGTSCHFFASSLSLAGKRVPIRMDLPGLLREQLHKQTALFRPTMAFPLSL